MKVNTLLGLLALAGALSAAFTNLADRNHFYPGWKYEKERINGKSIRYVSATHLAEQLYAKEKGIILVDMRDREAFDRYHIPSALPYKGRDEVEALCAEEPVILYGSATDEQVPELAGSLPRNVRVLKGGIEAWYELVLFPDFSVYQIRNSDILEGVIRRSRYFGGSPKQMQLLNISARENQYREGC